MVIIPVAGYGNEEVPLLKRDNVKLFVNKMVSEHNFNRQNLVDTLGKIQLQKPAIKIMKKPPESDFWFNYKKRHIVSSLIRSGVSFWEENKDALDRAEQMYGVPSHIILGILGIETRFGRYQGKTPVINALATFAFDYPRREKFFTNELEQFLLFAQEDGQDPFDYTGSYAGAMGMPQFMPSNYRKLAIDFDEDGKRDIWNNPVDAIGSIANYLNYHDWRKGELIAEVVSFPEVEKVHHKVMVGESLWGIASLYSSKSDIPTAGMVDRIYKQNHRAFIGDDKDRLKAGKILNITLRESAPDPSLISNQLNLDRTIGQIRAAGGEGFSSTVTDNTPVMFFKLREELSDVYWVGYHNFRVISRYNPRLNYTMAVFSLGEEIKSNLDKR